MRADVGLGTGALLPFDLVDRVLGAMLTSVLVVRRRAFSTEGSRDTIHKSVN